MGFPATTIGGTFTKEDYSFCWCLYLAPPIWGNYLIDLGLTVGIAHNGRKRFGGGHHTGLEFRV